jgi:hypothetical protein
MTKVLTREDVLAMTSLPTQVVEVPEWGGSVTVRGLTGDERDRYEQSIVTMKGSNVLPKFAGARARLVALSVVDDEGKRIFNDSDVQSLGRIAAGALQRVYNVARELSGMSEQDVEDLMGNSDGVQSDGSTSTSPELSDAQ